MFGDDGLRFFVDVRAARWWQSRSDLLGLHPNEAWIFFFGTKEGSQLPSDFKPFGCFQK